MACRQLRNLTNESCTWKRANKALITRPGKARQTALECVKLNTLWNRIKSSLFCSAQGKALKKAHLMRPCATWESSLSIPQTPFFRSGPPFVIRSVLIGLPRITHGGAERENGFWGGERGDSANPEAETRRRARCQIYITRIKCTIDFVSLFSLGYEAFLESE